MANSGNYYKETKTTKLILAAAKVVYSIRVIGQSGKLKGKINIVSMGEHFVKDDTTVIDFNTLTNRKKI